MADRDIVDTIVPWTTKIRTTSGNQVGGHASELTNDIGELTPAGRAYLAMPNNAGALGPAVLDLVRPAVR